jgi:peptidyl-tRNA hydrolase
MSRLRQVVLLRRDLLNSSRTWTFGALAAQAVHASVDCLERFRQDASVKEYLQDDNRAGMTTIILALKDQHDLVECHNKLVELEVDHIVWHEMPENIPTCIALKPCPKQSAHQSYIGTFPLFS